MKRWFPIFLDFDLLSLTLFSNGVLLSNVVAKLASNRTNLISGKVPLEYLESKLNNMLHLEFSISSCWLLSRDCLLSVLQLAQQNSVHTGSIALWLDK